MDVEEQIAAYLAGLPEPKRGEMEALHRLMHRLAPEARPWFLDGRDESGKIVSNPNIGYGLQAIPYANGKTREFYRVGLCANTSGISIYIMGIADKGLLARTYGGRLGKASVTGYCIKFRRLEDLDLEVLEEALRFGLEAPRDGRGAGPPE